MAAVAVGPAIQALRILVSQPHVVLYGDQALMELGARRAIQLDQLVGPYSRAGFHHPGPAVFYLLAPFVRVLEPAGPGLYLGATAVNGAALIAAVAVVWYAAGGRAALWTSLAVDGFYLCLGLGTFREPWNPYLVVAPLFLFLVLWATACYGSRACLTWALVVASYEIQTHVSTALVVLVLAGYMLIKRRRGGRAARSQLARAAEWGGWVVLVAAWVPPLLDLARDHPDNVQNFWAFFVHGQANAGFGQTMKVAADALSIVPFGYHDYVLSLHRNPFEVVVALALLAGGSALAFNLARRSGGGLSAHLAAGGIAVAVIGSFSLTRGDGPTYLYYAVWLSVASLAVMVALAVHEWSFRPWLPCVAMGVLIGSLALGQAPIDRTIGSGPWPAVDAQQRARTVTDTAVFGAAATRALLPSDRWVDVDIGAAGVWPYAAGLVLTLDEHGVQATVSPASWALYFGYERAPGRPVTAVLRLVPAGPTATHVIAQIDGTALEYRRTQVPSNGANP